METWPTTPSMNTYSKGSSHVKSGQWMDWSHLRPLANNVVPGPIRLSPFKTFNVRQRGDAEWVIGAETQEKQQRSHEAVETMIKQESWEKKTEKSRIRGTESQTQPWTGIIGKPWVKRGFQSHMNLQTTSGTFSWSQQCNYEDGSLSPLGLHGSL